ncbi:carbohydrate sulfotransferase 8-like isoform X1 [Gambusia affinis]|uniref:carbohydrate sulfotransferase 8-like isoform X1 n=3 Tax=Gambusia affinis TaxID=33528 RepID=UPI001CDD8FA7|nr:carbohydrate sulfotransferase 8-like isoform X1 [Gambusia affinis]
MVDVGALIRTYYIRTILCRIMVWMKLRMEMDSLWIRLRRMPRVLWFILLFGVGGALLFLYTEIVSEMFLQQGPAGMNSPRHSKEGLQVAEANPVSPMQHPNVEESKRKATTVSQEQDIGTPQITKRQRKLLKTSPHITHSKNVSLTSLPGFSTERSLSNLSSILEARKQVMKNMCAKYKSGISRTITPDHVKYIYVEEKYKVLYCEVPKSGCSNWKRTLIVLSGKASNPDSLNHEQVHYGGYLKTLNRFNQKEIMHRLQTYKKFMFVREPLDRVVSAYRDKFENPNEYYHNLFGKPIISKYRVAPSAEALKTGNGVTFKEFVQYLLDGHRPVGMDIHWEQINKLCHPCLIDYDLIGKFENMEEESNFLLRMIGAPDSLKLPSFKDRNPKDVRTSKEITEKYFSQVSLMEKQRAYDFYYMDYLMFNYSKPFNDLY